MAHGSIQSVGPPSSARWEGVSPLSLAALVTALHVSVLAGRVTGSAARPGADVLMVWGEPARPNDLTPPGNDHGSAHPTQVFAAGRLLLAAGMAVVTLAGWLQIMHLSGALGR